MGKGGCPFGAGEEDGTCGEIKNEGWRFFALYDSAQNDVKNGCNDYKKS